MILDDGENEDEMQVRSSSQAWCHQLKGNSCLSAPPLNTLDGRCTPVLVSPPVSPLGSPLASLVPPLVLPLVPPLVPLVPPPVPPLVSPLVPGASVCQGSSAEG